MRDDEEMNVSFLSNVILTTSKMARFTFAACLAVALFGIVAAQDQGLYSDKYDDIDVNELVTNDRLREQYYNCFMDTAPCVTQDAAFFKRMCNFPEAIVTKCKRCTEKQKANFEIVVSWYTDNRPEQWEALVAKFIEDAKKTRQ